jgi:hypothetical protein
MATGDSQDFAFRIKVNLPQHWFGDSSPVLDAIIAGLASPLAFVYSLIQYAKNQTRIGTATDGFLDLISFDYFGRALPRKSQEQDTPFRARILANLLRERGTRKGMILALEALTGRSPWIFEPARPSDTGAYNTNTMGYGVAGGYGSLKLNAQVFIVAFRPSGSGIPFVAGYGASSGGYSTPSRASWTSLSQIVGYVTDADLFSAVAAAKAEGVTAWTRLSN